MLKRIKTIEGIIGISIILLVVLVVFLGPTFTEYQPNDMDLSRKNLSPSDEHPLGTDHLGRCIFTRIIYGARYSIGTALLTLTMTFLFSLIYGFVSGYMGGRVDMVLTGISDLSMAFPPMVIVLSFIGVFDSDISGLVIAVIIASWPWHAKIIRSMVMIEKKKAYITAARLCGSHHLKIVVNHIIPNIFNGVMVMYFTGISSMILMISGFSYLGIGFSKEIPEWGTMLSDAKSYIFTRPELLIIPGLCIFVTSIGFNLIGELLRNDEG